MIESIADAVNRGFMWLVPVAALGFAVTLVMKAPPLRDGSSHATSHAASDAPLDSTDH